MTIKDWAGKSVQGNAILGQKDILPFVSDQSVQEANLDPLGYNLRSDYGKWDIDTQLFFSNASDTSRPVNTSTIIN